MSWSWTSWPEVVLVVSWVHGVSVACWVVLVRALGVAVVAVVVAGVAICWVHVAVVVAGGVAVVCRGVFRIWLKGVHGKPICGRGRKHEHNKRIPLELRLYTCYTINK